MHIMRLIWNFIFFPFTVEVCAGAILISYLIIYVNTMQEYNNKSRVLVNDGACYVNHCCNSIDSLFIE